jgi:hypothetical protein
VRVGHAGAPGQRLEHGLPPAAARAPGAGTRGWPEAGLTTTLPASAGRSRTACAAAWTCRPVDADQADGRPRGDDEVEAGEEHAGTVAGGQSACDEGRTHMVTGSKRAPTGSSGPAAQTDSSSSSSVRVVTHSSSSARTRRATADQPRLQVVVAAHETRAAGAPVPAGLTRTASAARGRRAASRAGERGQPAGQVDHRRVDVAEPGQHPPVGRADPQRGPLLGVPASGSSSPIRRRSTPSAVNRTPSPTVLTTRPVCRAMTSGGDALEVLDHRAQFRGRPCRGCATCTRPGRRSRPPAPGGRPGRRREAGRSALAARCRRHT